MRHPIILGLIGAPDCGKTTTAQLLETHVHARVMAFSDAVYAEVAQAFDCNIIHFTQRASMSRPFLMLALYHCMDTGFKQFAGDSGMLCANTPSHILQRWCDYRRAQDPDYWIKQIQTRIAHYVAAGCSRPIVLPDVATPTQAELVRNLGGTLWRIERPGICAPCQVESDLTLNNRGDIAHLQHVVLTQWHELVRDGRNRAAHYDEFRATQAKQGCTHG